jgi:hypothetical protein
MSPYKNIIAHQDFLKSLSNAAPKSYKRRLLISLASPKQIKTLQEVVHNVVKKNVPLSPCQIKRLVKGNYKKSILAAANKKGSVETKRKVFLQKGGFLQYILPAALTYLASQLNG